VVQAFEAAMSQKAELELLGVAAQFNQADLGGGQSPCTGSRLHGGEAAVPLQGGFALEDGMSGRVVAQSAARDATHDAVVDRMPRLHGVGIAEVEDQLGHRRIPWNGGAGQLRVAPPGPATITPATARLEPMAGDRGHDQGRGQELDSPRPGAARESQPAAAGRGARFVPRQRGSGTRLLLDHLCAAAGLDAARLVDEARAEDSHLAVAVAVASGGADVALGVEAAARELGLDFVPLVEEDYLLVCLRDRVDQPGLRQLRAVLQGPAWDGVVAALPGYRTERSGEVLSLTRTLPWWRLRTLRG
jgi:hypothetical protein